MSDIVLVHGAFHGGWCWRDAAAILRSQGHRVFTPTLTGLAERSHLLNADVGIETHARDITAVLQWEDVEDAVLVAHSYGGLPMIMAADRMPERLRTLVFLDAFVASDGEDAWTLRNAAPGAMALSLPQNEIAIKTVPAQVFGLSGDLAAWADSKLTPQPLAVMTQPIRLSGAWEQVAKKIYVRLAKYPAPYFDVCYERAAADPHWTAIRRDDIHNLFMTDPGWFVAMLNETALS